MLHQACKPARTLEDMALRALEVVHHLGLGAQQLVWLGRQRLVAETPRQALLAALLDDARAGLVALVAVVMLGAAALLVEGEQMVAPCKALHVLLAAMAAQHFHQIAFVAVHIAHQQRGLLQSDALRQTQQLHTGEPHTAVGLPEMARRIARLGARRAHLVVVQAIATARTILHRHQAITAEHRGVAIALRAAQAVDAAQQLPLRGGRGFAAVLQRLAVGGRKGPEQVPAALAHKDHMWPLRQIQRNMCKAALRGRCVPRWRV
ncbi:hypothetical protein SDC9_138634 [bioreactor metagenome]|uniref:Uncharacterized protein n=1 Tax=bioreactor metagenome TaxID=1076179 RepID=A0A645DS37_9ZZZZ